MFVLCYISALVSDILPGVREQKVLISHKTNSKLVFPIFLAAFKNSVNYFYVFIFASLPSAMKWLSFLGASYCYEFVFVT